MHGATIKITYKNVSILFLLNFRDKRVTGYNDSLVFVKK
jgi:hypothetical protein